MRKDTIRNLSLRKYKWGLMKIILCPYGKRQKLCELHIGRNLFEISLWLNTNRCFSYRMIHRDALLHEASGKRAHSATKIVENGELRVEK
jgi:hypothetical protein